MAIIAFIFILAAATLFVRIYFSTEKQVFQLRLGNYAKYIALFWAGIEAYRNRWFEKLSYTTGKQWTFIIVLSMLVYCVIIIFSWFSGTSLSFLGDGFSLWSLIANFVERFIAVGSCISLIYLFRRFCNAQPTLVKVMVENVYAVFIFYESILVAFIFLIRDTMTGYSFAKFLLAFIVSRYSVFSSRVS